MSEAELHLIRSRLIGGLWHKAAKGELRFWLPIGYEHDEAGQIVLSRNESVRAAVALVFAKFEEFGSARRIMTWMVAEGLQLPSQRLGSQKVNWVAPSYPLIHGILTNVTYAGAYAYGRSHEEKVVADGHIRRRTRSLPQEEWRVLLKDHHPGYITWAEYEANQERLRANVHMSNGESRGAPRTGPALLQGLLRCGRCGRRLQVTYSGTRGNCPRYACHQGARMQGVGTVCQSLGGRRLKKTVVDAFLEAVTPARIEATLQALNEAQGERQAVLAQWELRLEQARYEADRARRQYDAVEPENRLVARTLEQEWERRLAEVSRIERELEHRRLAAVTPLSESELAHIRRFGVRLQRIWEASTTEDRDRKQLLRTLIKDIIVQVDRAAAAADLTIVWEGGYRSDEMVGKSVSILIPPDRPDELPRIFERVKRGERIARYETVRVHKDGDWLQVSVTDSPVRDDVGRIIGIAAIDRDITEQKRAEQFREEYVALISHDLRSPLTTILGQADLLRRILERLGMEREAKSAAAMATSARRMNGMIQELVDSARLEAGRMEMRKEPTDLPGMVYDLLGRFGTPEERARIVVETPEYVPAVPADRQHVERAVTNLLTNALKYSPASTPIVVHVGERDGRALISVSDQGVGIPAEDVQHIFERHFRARTAGQREGLGLGLYITRLIVEAHRGRVWVESEVGKGSTFYIALPLS